jgi:hypothetical protein
LLAGVKLDQIELNRLMILLFSLQRFSSDHHAICEAKRISLARRTEKCSPDPARRPGQ